MDRDTIYALSSGAGRAGVAVVRVSGSQAGAVITALAGRAIDAIAPRRAHLFSLQGSADGGAGRDGGTLIDQALVLWFPAPGSFSGEDMAEFQVHGGRAVIAAVLSAIGNVAGTRFAEPGEFTKRAYVNGKMDLTAAEGIADLIDAETEAQRRQAARQMSGALAALYDDWRARLLRVAAHLEAVIDFAEEDIPDDLDRAAKAGAQSILADVERHLASAPLGQRLRDGVRVAIIGAPNVGKSTLLNMLAAREAAIVSDIAGTTRDVIEVHLDLGGVPVILSDTAGLRASEDVIEAEGIRRASAVAEAADLRIHMDDGEPSEDQEEGPDPTYWVDGDLWIRNKIDLRPSDAHVTPPASSGGTAFAVSLKSGEGVDSLVAALSQRASVLAGVGLEAVPTRARHVEALRECLTALSAAVDGWDGSDSAELVAEDVRVAVHALGTITGRVDVEEVLGAIFSEFCIGK